MVLPCAELGAMVSSAMPRTTPNPSCWMLVLMRHSRNACSSMTCNVVTTMTSNVVMEEGARLVEAAFLLSLLTTELIAEAGIIVVVIVSSFGASEEVETDGFERDAPSSVIVASALE